MTGSRDEEFRGFVVAQRRALLRLALLLTGDRDAADELVQTALLTTYRHWARAAADPLPRARRALVTTHLSRWQRLAHPPQVLTSAPARAATVPEAQEDEELLAALRQLPPRMRAVVVLRYFADLSEPETAEVVGCPAGTVRNEASRAVARLRELLTAATSEPEAGRR